MINAGELKKRLIIQKVVTIEDENGFPIETTEDIYKLRCKYKTVSTREYISANREITALTYKFICRKREIDSDMYVVFKDREFDIKHVHEFEDDMFVEITATLKE
ncbi:phage head closure protein [Bacillus sp. B3-WWTP-C-10-D-3]|uniref:phage head closure protein n=1 Tax=Bacillus sp. B3-WWTP-C-10-D-3 TaxID=2653217 RepID=UPI0012620B23|nr:phage head closure protein [Bacillus sp. B3-WWTP-C-10-D-3]KAB7640277.1 phage head closure protein [Bacillus sp. B3-WWTP-C-10-D-3]